MRAVSTGASNQGQPRWEAGSAEANLDALFPGGIVGRSANIEGPELESDEGTEQLLATLANQPVFRTLGCMCEKSQYNWLLLYDNDTARRCPKCDSVYRIPW